MPSSPDDPASPEEPMRSAVRPDLDIEAAKKSALENFDTVRATIVELRRAREVTEKNLQVRFKA